MLRTLQILLLAYASRQGPAPLTPKWSRETVLVDIQGDDGYTFALAATWRTCCTPRSLSKFLVDQDLADRNMLKSCKGHCKVLNAIAI